MFAEALQIFRAVMCPPGGKMCFAMAAGTGGRSTALACGVDPAPRIGIQAGSVATHHVHSHIMKSLLPAGEGHHLVGHSRDERVVAQGGHMDLPSCAAALWNMQLPGSYANGTRYLRMYVMWPGPSLLVVAAT